MMPLEIVKRMQISREWNRRPFGPRRHLLPAAAAFVALAVSGCGPPDRPLIPEHTRIVRIRVGKPGTARLEGIGPIRGFAKQRDCTFMHCLELLLEAVGRNIGYDELMGVSGLAFRLQVRVDRWDVGNPDPAVGDSVLDPLFAAIGVEYELRVVRREELAEADALRRVISASIDNGFPVLAANVIPPEDWGIITGYQRNGWAWTCRSYNGDARQHDRTATGWPTAVLIVKQIKPRPAPKPEHAKSIRRAVELFEKSAFGSYATGRNAFEHWCQMLRSADSRRHLHPNAWTYVGLIDARQAATRYLRSIADEFGAKKRSILEAAAFYEQETRTLIDGLANVPSENQYSASEQSSALRAMQISTLMKAKALEERAIQALRAAM